MNEPEKKTIKWFVITVLVLFALVLIAVFIARKSDKDPIQERQAPGIYESKPAQEYEVSPGKDKG